MKKVLVLSYFFPPCNLTPSNRAFSWARHLQEFGYYPGVVSRRWDHPVTTSIDAHRPTETTTLVERNPGFELHAVPYLPSLRDRLLVRWGLEGFKGPRRILSAAELVSQNFSNLLVPFSNMYRYSRELLVNDPEFAGMVVTANPYVLFRFGWLLSAEFGVPWIADYRDEWTTSQIASNHADPATRWLRRLERRSERTWVGSASRFTSVSEGLVKRIGASIAPKGAVLLNGFAGEDFEALRSAPRYERFTITYVGALYADQRVEIFLDAYRQFVRERPDSHALLQFIGAGYAPDQRSRLDRLMRGFDDHYRCTDRVSRQAALEAEARSHLLLYVGWAGYQGIVGSKLYEYIGSGTFTLLTPSDADVAEATLRDSGAGAWTNSVDETLAFLRDSFESFVSGHQRQVDTSQPSIRRLSRREQTKRLAELLDQLPARRLP